MPGLRSLARGLRFRAETQEDLPFLAALYASTRQEELAAVPWAEAQKQAFLLQQFNAQHAHYRAHYPAAHWLIVEKGGTAIGRLYLEEWPTQIRVIDIALGPHVRGSGFGTAMLQDVMEQAAAKAKAVSIHVEKHNLAMRLYRRLGFERIEDKGVYDLMEWSPEGRAGEGFSGE